MANAKQAGHIDIEQLNIKSYDGSKNIDIRALVSNFTITESMNMSSVRGHLLILESFDILTKFPLVGEELLEIVYTDFFDNTRTETYCIYAIDSISRVNESSPNLVSYNIHFVSPGKFLSDKHRIEKAFNNNLTGYGTISFFVKQVYDQYLKSDYNKKTCIIEPTYGDVSIVVPSLTPEQTIHFFSRRSFSAESTSQSFRFFENRDNFYFITNEKLLELAKNGVGYGPGLIDPNLANKLNIKTTPIPIFTQSWMANVGPEAQSSLMSEFIYFDLNGVANNTLDNMDRGRYRRKTIELDILNGIIAESDYDSANEIQFPEHNTNEFIEDNLNKPTKKYVVKDYSTPSNSGSGLRTDTHYSTLYNKKPGYFVNFDKNKIKCTIYGRNSIVAGSVLDVQIFKTSVVESLDIDQKRSGRFIIDTVNNIFDKGVYTQELILSREGFNYVE